VSEAPGTAASRLAETARRAASDPQAAAALAAERPELLAAAAFAGGLAFAWILRRLG
jgi:hypothetical protein